MNKEQIIALVNKYTEKVQKSYPQFKKPSVTFDITGKCAGQARFLKHEVSFNLILARDNPSAFENTISHEIAHLLTSVLYPNAKQAHGPEFKRIHKWMGGTGNTYHSYDIRNVKKRKVTLYKYVCMCDSHSITAKRHDLIRNHGNNYCCNKCNVRIKPLVQNGRILTETKYV